MSEAEYADDIARVERDYTDPQSTSREDVRADLEDSDFANETIPMFEDGILTEDEIEVPDRTGTDPTTREDVSELVDAAKRDDQSGFRSDAVTDAVATKEAAPSKADLDQARVAIASENLTDETPEGLSTPTSVLRSDPDLDPLSEGGEGRELGRMGTRGDGTSISDFEQVVEPNPDGESGTLIFERNGERYPMKEVDL